MIRARVGKEWTRQGPCSKWKVLMNRLFRSSTARGMFLFYLACHLFIVCLYMVWTTLGVNSVFFMVVCVPTLFFGSVLFAREYSSDRRTRGLVFGGWFSLFGLATSWIPFYLPLYVWLPAMFLLVGLLFVIISLAALKRKQFRGRCLVCGYSRRSLPAESPCPECGHPKVQHPRARGLRFISWSGGPFVRALKRFILDDHARPNLTFPGESDPSGKSGFGVQGTREPAEDEAKRARDGRDHPEVG